MVEISFTFDLYESELRWAQKEQVWNSNLFHCAKES